VKDLVFSFFTALTLVIIATPALIKVAKLKHLVDEPGDERKLHRRSVPTIGGIMIFAGTIIGYCLWFPSSNALDLGENYEVLGALQEFKFWGLFFVDGKLPFWVSIAFSVFVYIVIVNAINLIDGVDGLAAGIGLIASITFAFWFFGTGDFPLALLATSLGGSLMGFLFYNWNPAKIFMGDSGSLIIGVVIYVLAVKMIEFPMDKLPARMTVVSKPVLAMSILAYPLIDTLRVFIKRSLQGRSPFSADKNHIHHKLLSLGIGHRGTSLILYAFTAFIILLTFLTPAHKPNVSFMIVAGAALFLTNLVFFIKRKEKE
jgi:UDP-GlcNAc:undecaprenyl-phosphate/decaprenyl-phosphate GlcNAc-1-phosphate transferase